MEEQLISFETAKLAKEKGYEPDREWNPEYVKGYIDEELTEFKEEDYYCDGYFLAPAQALLQKWLREEHTLDVFPTKVNKNWQCSVYTWQGWQHETNSFKTYEEALEAGLQEALKLIK